MTGVNKDKAIDVVKYEDQGSGSESGEGEMNQYDYVDPEEQYWAELNWWVKFALALLDPSRCMGTGELLSCNLAVQRCERKPG